MKMKRLILCLLLFPIGLCACSKPSEDPVITPKNIAVRVETITTRDLPIVANSVGRLTANREVVLSTEVTGIVIGYDVDVGAKVTKGAPIVKLDPADYRLALEEAQANLRAAKVMMTARKNSFDRAKGLLPGSSITPDLFDQSEAEYKSSSAQVAQMQSMVALARRRLEKTTITAPFTGYVTRKFVEIGQSVAVGNPVMEIADMNTMRVKININELAYVHLDKEDPVEVTVEAFSQTPLVGQVDRIGIRADSRTNTFEVEILVDNPDIHLKAGLTARVAIQTKVIRDAVMIPQSTVLYRGNRQEVFVIESDNLAAARKIKMGPANGSDVTILEGLLPGDRLVVEGGQYLKPGDQVVIEP